MDDTENQNTDASGTRTHQESQVTIIDITEDNENCIDNIKQENRDNRDHAKNKSFDDAGPSRDLPGAIPPKVLQKTGLSKSEHNIRHIITCSDVTNALQLTSISFAQNNRRITDLNLQELHLPRRENENTFVNLTKFMAACFQTTDAIPSVAIPNETTVAEPKIDIPSTNVINPNTSENDVKLLTKSEEKKKPLDLGLTARDSMSSIGSNVCRICMTRGRERLISPCNCKGSLANVHLTCLERWLNQVGRHHCELCGYSYPAIRTPRYTVLQALRLWFGNPRNRGHLQSDCLIFWLLSTVTAGLLAVCVVGTQYFVVEGNKFGKPHHGQKDEGISHRITETAMDFFMAIVLCGYSVTVYLLWKDHFIMWNRWRRANVNVRLLLSPDSSPVPFVPRRYHVV